MSETKERKHWLDIGKGLAMLCIMWVHIHDLFPWMAGQIIQPFYLSFFFIASGVVFSQKGSFKEFLLNKCRSLLIPLFCLSTISILTSQIVSTGSHSLIEDFKGLFLQIRGKDDYMWFVACLFLSEIIFYFVVLVKNTYTKWAIYITGLCLSIFLYKSGVPSLPWHLETMGVSVFFLGVGYEIHAHSEQLTKFSGIKYLFIGALLFALLLIFKIVQLKDYNVVQINAYESNALVWTGISMISCFAFIQAIICINRCELLEFIGRNTLIYFAFQTKFQRILEIVFKKLNFYSLPLSKYYLGILIVVIEALCLAVVAIIFNRYFYFLLGRKKPMLSQDKNK